MEPWAATNVAVTPAPVRVPTQRPLVPSFTSVVGHGLRPDKLNHTHSVTVTPVPVRFPNR